MATTRTTREHSLARRAYLNDNIGPIEELSSDFFITQNSDPETQISWATHYLLGGCYRVLNYLLSAKNVDVACFSQDNELRSSGYRERRHEITDVDLRSLMKKPDAMFFLEEHLPLGFEDLYFGNRHCLRISHFRNGDTWHELVNLSRLFRPLAKRLSDLKQVLLQPSDTTPTHLIIYFHIYSAAIYDVIINLMPLGSASVTKAYHLRFAHWHYSEAVELLRSQEGDAEVLIQEIISRIPEDIRNNDHRIYKDNPERLEWYRDTSKLAEYLDILYCEERTYYPPLGGIDSFSYAQWEVDFNNIKDARFERILSLAKSTLNVSAADLEEHLPNMRTEEEGLISGLTRAFQSFWVSSPKPPSAGASRHKSTSDESQPLVTHDDVDGHGERKSSPT